MFCCKEVNYETLPSKTEPTKRHSCLKYVIAVQFILIAGLVLLFIVSTVDGNSAEFSIANTNTNAVRNPVLSVLSTESSTNNNSNTDAGLDLPSQFPLRPRYCADPLGLISELLGRWYSDDGVDTVQISVDPLTLITTYYTEFLTFEPMSYGILNPRFSASSLIDAEELFGVRYFRQVIANHRNPNDSVFAASSPIHEECGYILFAFLYDANGMNPQFSRVVKSIAIPRGETVLAHAEYADKRAVFDQHSNSVVYNLTAGTMFDVAHGYEEYSVGNAAFTRSYAWVPFYMEDVVIDMNKHLFSYFQQTPLIFGHNAHTSEHNNWATLTKLNN